MYFTSLLEERLGRKLRTTFLVPDAVPGPLVAEIPVQWRREREGERECVCVCVCGCVQVVGYIHDLCTCLGVQACMCAKTYFVLNSHFKRGSLALSPLMRTKKKTEKGVLQPRPAQFRYTLIHLLKPFL